MIHVLPTLKNMSVAFLPWREGWVATGIQELILTYRSTCLDKKSEILMYIKFNY